MIPKKKKRQLEIEDYIQLKNKVSLDELAEKFKVNRITIHRDLSDLEEGGKIRKVISGAIAVSRSLLDTSSVFYNRAINNWEEKCAISKKAMDFIQPNKFYFFDGSSTLLPLVQNLSRSDIKDISILTANIIFQLELSMNENIKIIGLGGEVNRNMSLTSGPYAWKNIENFNSDILLFSTAGISEDLVLTDSREDHAMNIKLFIEHSKTKILLADHTKFENSGYFTICNMKDVDVIITDNKIKQNYIDKLNKITGLKVIITS
ncbi:MAG: DeoR/GlpR family DNA-binding transcription regulator [Actinobacteria bacterium]|nr:DeoR/GlpR family DNA-binding transcription regulator [Actinomycetota bacterium]